MLGHGADLRFDHLVHALRVGFDVVAREVRPGVADFEDVALVAGQAAGDCEEHARFGGARQAGEAGNRGGLDAEEGDKNRVAATKVHVRQVVKRPPGAHGFDGGQRAVLPGKQHLVAEAFAAAVEQRVEDGIFLRGVDAQRVKAHGERDAAGIQTDEVRRQHDDGLAGIEQGADFFLAVDADQPV